MNDEADDRCPHETPVTNSSADAPPSDGVAAHSPFRLQVIVTVAFLLIMGAELVSLIIGQRWGHVSLVAGLIVVIASPIAWRNGPIAAVPVEIQFSTALFIFATLFLGEVGDFYIRIWWWDLALHATSGVLLGLLGFLVIYLMNESHVVSMHLRPSFVAFVAFFFSIGLGALWEIFEFAMDQLFGLNMQKPMLGDPSGLTDTMWDLIVDAIGALAASLAGLSYMLRARKEGRIDWLQRFVRRYPDLFA